MSTTLPCSKLKKDWCNWANGKTDTVPDDFKKLSGPPLKAARDATKSQLKKCKTCNDDKKKNKGLIIGLAVGGGVLLIAGIVIAIILLMKHHGAAVSPTPGAAVSPTPSVKAGAKTATK